MADGTNWQCAHCGSENLAADSACGTCSRPRDPGAAPLAASGRAVRVEDHTQRALGGAPPSQRPLGAAAKPVAAPPRPPSAPPSYTPAAPFPSAAAAPGATPARVLLGWGASFAILAGLYFGYRYLIEHPRQPGAAPPPIVQTQPFNPFNPPQQTTAPQTAPAYDYRTWAVAASTEELRAAVIAAGPNSAAATAELRDRSQTAWNAADAAGTIESVVTFLNDWPDAAQQSAARARLNSLLDNLDMRDVPQAISPQQSAIREAPLASARVIGQVRANQALSGQGLVRYGGRQWIVTRAGGRRGYVDSGSFRVYRAPAETPTAPPPTPPRVVTTAPPSTVVVRPAERLTDPARATYPSRGRGDTGEVQLSFTVTESGQVRDIRVISETPPGRGFSEAAIDAMRGVRYRARREDGRAVESRETLRFVIRPPSD